MFGTIKRNKPRIEVLRGFNPNEPHTLTAAHPVASGVTILSGQVVSKNWNSSEGRYEWIKGCTTAGLPVFFALQDSTDEDVLEAGNLVGLSSAGEFEIETAFYKSADTYNDGVYLTYDGVTGDVKATTAGGASSGTHTPIIGQVTRIRGPRSLKGENSNVVVTDVISFNTLWIPNNWVA